MSGEDLIQFRQGSAAAWISTNPTLSSGEPGYETDTGRWKIGDGSTAWDSLRYVDIPHVTDDATASTFTLGISNMFNNTITRMTDSGALAITIDTESNLGAAVLQGAMFGIRAAGAGGVTSWTTTGLTINGTLPTLSQHEEVWLRRVAQDEYDVVL